jgi:hypothetical protein
MPEQAEWQPNTDNAGDYRWHPTYARPAMDSLNPAYDTRTLAQKLDEALQRIAHLEAMMHKYINQDGTL